MNHFRPSERCAADFVRRGACRPGVTAFALLGAALAFAPGARAASFDCAKASSPMEKAICSDKELSTADEALAAAYRKALAPMPAETAAVFRADQRRWLLTLERGCQIADVAESAKDGKPVDVADDSPEGKANLKRMAGCMNSAYRERMDAMKDAYVTVDGVAFVTRSLLLLAPDSSPDKDEAAREQFPGFGSLSITWAEAQSPDPRWQAWNAGVVRRMQAFAGESADVKTAAGGWKESLAADVDSSLGAGVPTVRQGRATATIAIDGMGHTAAHPYEASMTFTWMLEAKRPFNANDIFAPGTPWKRTLAASAWKQVKGSEGLYDPQTGGHSKALLDTVGNVGNWTLTAEGLSINWPEYSLSPRVYPLDSAVVPWGALRPLLAPGFVP